MSHISPTICHSFLHGRSKRNMLCRIKLVVATIQSIHGLLLDNLCFHWVISCLDCKQRREILSLWKSLSYLDSIVLTHIPIKASCSLASKLNSAWLTLNKFFDGGGQSQWGWSCLFLYWLFHRSFVVIRTWMSLRTRRILHFYSLLFVSKQIFLGDFCIYQISVSAKSGTDLIGVILELLCSHKRRYSLLVNTDKPIHCQRILGKAT